MSMFDLILMGIMAGLLVASGGCSATETTLFGLTHAERVQLRRQSPRVARRVERLMANPRSVLITILVLNTVVNVTFFALASLLTARQANAFIGAAIGAGGLLAIILFGEVFPKLLANAHRLRFATVLVPLVAAANTWIGPLRVVIERMLVAPLARVLVPREVPPPLEASELAALLDVASREGLIELEDHRLLGDVIELGQLRVRDVMTPRNEVVWVDASSDVEELASIARTHGLRVVPVCEGSIDEGVIGLVSIRRALGAVETAGVGGGLSAGQGRGGARTVREFLAPPRFVPDRARLDQLLETFRDQKSLTAICVDESGAVTGLVDIDDIVRQLGLGTIEPGSETTEPVVKVGENQWRVSGRLRVHDWAQLFDAEREARTLDQRASTVAGLITLRLGRLPHEGDEATIGRLRLRVESMRGRSVDRVIVGFHEAATDAPNAP